MGPVWAFSMCMSSSLGIHIVVHLPAKFRPNCTTCDRVMTSCPFFKIAATASQFYFRFRFSWLRSFENVAIYPRTKFRQDTWIHGWDTTSSGFGTQTSAMIEFYFRFQFLRLRHHVILHMPTKFRPNRTIRDRVVTSYPFSRWRPSAILNFLKGNCRPPMKCKCGSQVCLFIIRLPKS